MNLPVIFFRLSFNNLCKHRSRIKTIINLCKNRPHFHLWLYLLFIPILTNAQDTLKISYKGSIPFRITEDSYVFDLAFEDREKKRFDSKGIKNYIFDKPGIYKIYPISIHNHLKNHDCTLIHLPDSIVIYTDRFSMQFIDSTLKLKAPIYKNQSTKGNYIEIQVNVINTFDNSPIILFHRNLYSVGIGTKITGELDSNSMYLKKGINTLRYNLDGICNMNSFIQFDFIDNIGQAHPISLSSPVK